MKLESIADQRHDLTGSGVQSVLFNFSPATSASTLYLLFFPNENLAVVGTRRQDMSIFWMCPGYLPDWPDVTFERVSARPLRVTFCYVE